MKTSILIAPFRPRKILAGALSVAYLVTHVIGAHAAESGFWTSRREAVRQHQKPAASKPAAPVMVAGLPAGFDLPAFQPRALGAPPSSETDSAAVSGGARRHFSEIDLPRWLADVVAPHGAIRDVHLSGRAAAPLVIHVQDLHDSVEAQRHIAGLIGDLQDARGVSLVGLEGAQGEFALDAFRSYPDAGLLRQVADHFMAEGFLGGPEFAGLTLAQPPLLWGVEDSKLYEANLAVVKESARRRPSLDAFTAQARSVLVKVKDRRLPARLMDFDQRLSAYQAGRLGLGDYVKYLLRVAPTPTLRYGNLHLLEDALSWEAQLDKKKIESERALILDQLARRLPREELDRLVAQSALYRLGRLTYGDFHRFFRGLCLRHGVTLEDHTHFNNYIRYILLAERINRNDLMVELDTLQDDVQGLLCLTPEERRVMAAARHLALVERLARHAYTPMDWRYHEAHRAALHGLGEEIAALARDVGVVTDLVSPPEDLFRPFESFCGDAINRNAALVRGLLEKMRAENKTAAVLVAGGFHTEGLTHLLRQQGVSYAVITPKVTGAPPAGSKTLDLLASDPAPLEKLFAGETLNIPTPRLTAPSNAGLPLARRLVMLKAALLAALTIFATNAPLSPAAAQSLQSWPVLESVTGRARSPTDAAITIRTEDGQKMRLRAVAGLPAGRTPDYRATVGGTDVSLESVDTTASLARRLQDRWDAMFFVGVLARRRKAVAATAPAALDTTPFPQGQDPWGSRDAGDRAILEAVESGGDEVYVFSGDVDLSAKANASVGKIAIGSIQESQSPDLVAARGASPFWEIRAALGAAMKEVGADIYAGAGGDEFRGVVRGEDAPQRLAEANRRLNHHFVGRYQFFQIIHRDPDSPKVQTELAKKIREWVDTRTPEGMFRLVRFGSGFSLVVPRADRRWFTSIRLRRALGPQFRVRERVLERLGLGPLTVSMGVVSVRAAKNLLISVAGARLASSARALSVWVQRFANDALGEAKNRGRNQIFAPGSLTELTDVLKKGSVTVQHVQQLRDQIDQGAPPNGLATKAADGKTRVMPLGEFWSAVKTRRDEKLDLYVFSVVRYTPTRRGALTQRINDALRRVPARYRRWVPGSLLRRVDAYIQKRAFHEYQGSDYEKGNRAIAAFVKHATETVLNGSDPAPRVLFGRSVDTVFAAVPRQGTGKNLPLSAMMEGFRNSLDAAEGSVFSQPRTIVYQIRAEDFKNLAATTGGVLDTMAHVEELLETYSREATAYLGGDLSRGALRDSLKEVFNVRAGANFLELTYAPEKAARMMALYRKSQTEDADRAESILFARAPQDLGSLLYRGYARALRSLGISDHRARLWLGSRYAQAVIIPAVELFGLPGAAWLLSPLMGWGVAVVLGSALFTLLHGLPGLTRGPPALRQEWAPFFARLIISLLINAAALTVGAFNAADQILPVFELAGIPSTALILSYTAHAGWNFLVPEKYRLSLIPGDKKVAPVFPIAPTGDALRSPKEQARGESGSSKATGGPGELRVPGGLADLGRLLDEIEDSMKRRALTFTQDDRDALHFAVRLAAPIYANTPRTDPYAPATPFDALRRAMPTAPSVDGLIGALRPGGGPVADALFGSARAAAYLQGKVMSRDQNTFVDLIRAGAALEKEAGVLSDLSRGGEVSGVQLRDAYLTRGPPLSSRLATALTALRWEGRSTADEILAHVEDLSSRHNLLWAERGVLYMLALTRGEGSGSVRGPPVPDPSQELGTLLRAARAAGGVAENKWSETQRSISQAFYLLSDFGQENPEALPAIRFAIDTGNYIARFGGNERVLLAGLIAGVGIHSPAAGQAFWKYVEKKGFGVQRVESLRWVRELAKPWADAHLVRYQPPERSLGAIRNQMGVIAQRLGNEDPDLVAQLLWAGKLAELNEITANATRPVANGGRFLVQEISDVHARFAERFGQAEASTQILDEVFRLTQPSRYRRIKNEFQRVTGMPYEEARDRFQKLVPEFEGRLASAGAVNAEVHGRVKGLWSISQKLANKKVSMNDIKDLFGFYVAYDEASAKPGPVRRVLKEISEGEFLEDSAETHIGADYSIHKIVSRLAASTALPGARLEIQLFDSDDFLRSKEGVAARWVYGLGKEIKPSGWVRIDRMEYTGNLRDDLKFYQSRARESGFVYILVETGNGQTIPIRMIDPMQNGSLIPADAAAHWRVDALNNGYQGFELLSPGPAGRPVRTPLDEDKPLVPGAVIALTLPDDSRPDVNDAAMDLILSHSRRGRTMLMARLARGEENLKQLIDHGRRAVLSQFFRDAPFSRVPDITEFEIRQLSRLAKSAGFGANVGELYAYIGTHSGAARDDLAKEVSEYLTIDTVKARRGPAVGMTAVVNGRSVDLYKEGYEIVEITGRHDRPAALLDVVKILKSYRIKVNDFIYLPQVNGGAGESYVIQLAVKARSSYLDKALADMQQQIADVPRSIEDPLLVNVEVIASRGSARAGGQEPDVEFLEALRETNIVDNIRVETLANGDLQMQVTVACPRGFLPFLESDLNNRFGADAYVSVRKKNGLSPTTWLPVLIAPVLTGLVGLLSATPAYSAVETAAPATMGLATHLVLGLVIVLALGLVWRASPDWLRRRFSKPSPSPAPTSTGETAEPGSIEFEGGARAPGVTVDLTLERWLGGFEGRAEARLLENSTLNIDEMEQARGFIADVRHALQVYADTHPSRADGEAIRKAGDSFIEILAVSRYKLISQNAFSLMSMALPLTSIQRVESAAPPAISPSTLNERDAFFDHLEKNLRRLNPGVSFKNFEIERGGRKWPVVLSDDVPMSYLRVGALMAVRPEESVGDGLALDPELLAEMREREHGFLMPGGITYGSYLVPVLAAMQGNASRFEDAVVEDAGAGNGLLTWAALRLGARRVIAVERDSAAVEELRANLAARGVTVTTVGADALKKGLTPSAESRVLVVHGTFADWFGLSSKKRMSLAGTATAIRLANVGPSYEEGHRQVLRAALTDPLTLHVLGGYAWNKAPYMGGLFADLDPRPYESALAGLLAKSPAAPGAIPVVERVDHEDGSLVFSTLVIARREVKAPETPRGTGVGMGGRILPALLAPVAGLALLMGFGSDVHAAGLPGEGRATDQVLIGAGVVGAFLLGAAGLGVFGVRLKREFFLWLEYRWPVIRQDFEAKAKEKARGILALFQSPTTVPFARTKPRVERPMDISRLSPESILPEALVREIRANLSPLPTSEPSAPRALSRRVLRWMIWTVAVGLLITASSPVSAADVLSMAAGVPSGDTVGAVVVAASIGGITGSTALPRVLSFVDRLRNPFEQDKNFDAELNALLFSIRRSAPALDALSGALRYLINDRPGDRQMALLRIVQRVEVLRALRLAEVHNEIIRRAMREGRHEKITSAMAVAGLEFERLREEWRGFPEHAHDVLVPVERMAGYFMEEISGDLVGHSVARGAARPGDFNELRKVAERSLSETLAMIASVREATVDLPSGDFLPVLADIETIDMHELAERGALAKMVRREAVRTRWQLSREMRSDVVSVGGRLLSPVHADANKLREIEDALLGRVELYAETPRLLDALRAEILRLLNSGRLDGEPFEGNREVAKKVLEAIDSKSPLPRGGPGRVLLLLAMAAGGAALWAFTGVDSAATLAPLLVQTAPDLLSSTVPLSVVEVVTAGFLGGVITGRTTRSNEREADLQIYWLKLTPRLGASAPVPAALNDTVVSALAEIETGARSWPILLWFYSNRLRSLGGFHALNKMIEADIRSPEAWLSGMAHEFRDRLVIANARELRRFSGMLRGYARDRLREAEAAAQRARDNVPLAERESAARRVRAEETARSKAMETNIENDLPVDLARIVREDYQRISGLLSAISSDEGIRLTPGALESFSRALDELLEGTAQRLSRIEYALALRPSGDPLEREAGSDALDVSALLRRLKADQRVMSWMAEQGRVFFGSFSLESLLRNAQSVWSATPQTPRRTRAQATAERARGIVSWMLSTPEGPGVTVRNRRPFGLPHWSRWLLNEVLRAAGFSMAPPDRKLIGRVNRVVRRMNDPRVRVKDISILTGAAAPALSLDDGRFVMAVRDQTTGRLQVRVHENTLARWISQETRYPGYFETVFEASLRHALARADGVPAQILEGHGLTAEGVARLQESAIYKGSVSDAVARAHGLAAGSRLVTRTDLQVPPVGPASGVVTEALNILAPEAWIQPLSRTITLEEVREDVNDLGQSRREKLADWVGGLRGETIRVEGRENDIVEWGVIFEASRKEGWNERQRVYESQLMEILSLEGGDDPRRTLRAQVTRDLLRFISEGLGNGDGARPSAARLDALFELVGRLHALGGALTLADDGVSENKARLTDTLLPAYQDLDIRLLGELGVAWLGSPNLVASLNRSAERYSHAVLQGVRLREARIAFDEAMMRDGDVLFHVSPGMVNADAEMTPSERTQLEQIVRLNSALFVLDGDLKKNGRFVFLTEEGVQGALPDILDALGKKAARAGLTSGMGDLASFARRNGPRVFARSLAPHTTHTERSTRVDAESVFNSIPDLTSPYLFRLDQPDVVWYLGAWADRVAAELVAAMGGLVRDQARRVSEELRKVGVLRYQA